MDEDTKHAHKIRIRILEEMLRMEREDGMAVSSVVLVRIADEVPMQESEPQLAYMLAQGWIKETELGDVVTPEGRGELETMKRAVR